jgi:uncharacterized membrane protein
LIKSSDVEKYLETSTRIHKRNRNIVKMNKTVLILVVLGFAFGADARKKKSRSSGGRSGGGGGGMDPRGMMPFGASISLK